MDCRATLRALCFVATLLVIAPGAAHAQWQDGIHVLQLPSNFDEFEASTTDSLSFWVKYYANDPELYDLDDFDITFSCPALLTNCQISDTQVTLAPVDSAKVTVTFNTTATTGSGTVWVTATGTFSGFEDTGGDGFSVIPVDFVSASISPTGTAVYAGTEGHQLSVTVTNLSTAKDTFAISCVGDVQIASCTPSVTSLILDADADSMITATFATHEDDESSIDTVSVSANGRSADTAHTHVDVFVDSVDVAQWFQQMGQRQAGAQDQTVSFTITNTTSLPNTFALTCRGAGGTTCDGVTPDTIFDLVGGASFDVQAQFDVGSLPGTDTLWLNAVGKGVAVDSGSYTIPVTGSAADPLSLYLVTPQDGTVPAGVVHPVDLLVTNNEPGNVTIVPGCTVKTGDFTCDEGTSFTIGTDSTHAFTIPVTTPSDPTAIDAEMEVTVVDQQDQTHADTLLYSFHIHRFTSAIRVAADQPTTAATGTHVDVDFWVTNTGTIDGKFMVSCSGACSDSSIVNIAKDDSTTVTLQAYSVSEGSQAVIATSRAVASGHVSDPAAVHSITFSDVPNLEVRAIEERWITSLSATDTAEFEVVFDEDGAQLDLTLSCEGDVTCGLVVGGTTHTMTGLADTVEVTFTAGSTDLDSGTVSLEARSTGDPPAQAIGSMTVVARAVADVSLGDANPGLEEVLSECLSIAAGIGSVICDDFQFSYPLTPILRLNRPRTFGLFYNSAHVDDRKIIGANVTTPRGGDGADSVVAELRLEGALVDSATHLGSLFEDGIATRVAFEVEESEASTEPLVNYQVDVTVFDTAGAELSTVVEGHYLSVDRGDAFGDGWWAAGYERLFVADDDSLGADLRVWVGGDGSTRLYMPDTTQTPVTRWIAESRGVRDTITVVAGSPPDSASYIDLNPTPAEGGKLEAGEYRGLTGMDQLTVAFWIRGDDVYGRIFGLIGKHPHRSWWVQQSEHTVWFAAQEGTAGSTAHIQNGTLDTLAWNFVVLEYDGTESVADDRVRIFMNGTEGNTTAGGPGDMPASLNAATDSMPFNVGIGETTSTGTVYPMYGDLGELAVFDGLVSDSAKSDWHTNGIDFHYPGLATGYVWRGDLTDVSTNRNHLTAQNISSADYFKTDDYPTRYARPAGYIRKIPGGGEVHFSAEGRHTKTVDRNGNETVFHHDSIAGEVRLTSIDLPTESGSTEAIRLSYDDLTAVLDSIQVVDGAGGWAKYEIYTSFSGGEERLDSIRAPDGLKHHFGYDADGLLTSIEDPRSAETEVDYEHQKVDEVRVVTSDPAQTATLDYKPAVALGLGAATATDPVPLDSVRAFLDGPRPSAVGDTTSFFVTGWGAVRGIRDALGHSTWLERRNQTFPSLVTRVRYPNTRIVDQWYSPVGLLNVVREVATDARTVYEWDSSLRVPELIQSPEGVVTTFGYDSYGNREYQEVAGDTVRFRYTDVGVVDSIRSPLGHWTVLAYDSLGNLESETSPLDVTTSFYKDARGLDTLVVTPIDTIDDKKVRTVRDAMGRDTLSVTTVTGPDSATWLEVRTIYDGSTGDRIKVEPWSYAPSDTAKGAVSEWVYDDLGRVIAETSTSANSLSWDTLSYDIAGNLTTRKTARGHTITTVYDALNRVDSVFTPLVEADSVDGTIDPFPFYEPDGLTIPADTAVFAYDEMGNLESANNRYAQVSRQYELDGLVKSETLRIRRYGGGEDFNTHVFATGYRYDRDRRRTRVLHPSWTGTATGETVYAYHPTTGRLQSVAEPNGTTLTFTWDADGRMRAKRFAGGGVDTLTYDDGGRLTSRDITTTHVTGVDSVSWSVEYDLRDLVIEVDGKGPTALQTYAGLGHLSSSTALDIGGNLEDEEFLADALGSVIETLRTFAEGPGDDRKFVSGYDTSGRINLRSEAWNQTNSQPTGWEPDSTSYAYDASGNRNHSLSFSHTWTDLGQPSTSKVLTFQEETRSYYSADQKLMVHQISRDSIRFSPSEIEEGHWGAYEEYWYDALGRRVMKRTRQDSALCEIGNRCYSAIERYAWDGEQILWETRQQGAADVLNPQAGAQTGVAGYVHGLDVDAPLAAMLNGQTMFLHRNWRGLHQLATDTAGDYAPCDPEESTCDVFWAAGSLRASLESTSKRTPQWVGSLAVEQKDATGLLYRRNRYYDPASGQFTQEDPIGIAGGLNLYGYANGDPINFSDPFGLCPWCLGGLIGGGIEAGAQLLFEGRLDAKRILVAGASGAATGGVSTLARIGMAGRAAVTSAISVGEGMLKAAANGSQTTFWEDVANAAFGSLGSSVGEVVGEVADDAAFYMLRNSRVGSGFSDEARAQMLRVLNDRLDEAAVNAAIAAGLVGQGGRVTPGGGG